MELQFYIAWPQKMSLIRLHFSGNFEKRKNKPGKQKVIPSRAKEQVLKLQGKNRLPGGSVVKNPPAVQETWVQSLGWEDPISEEMPTHFSVLAWEIPWTEQPSGLCSPWVQQESDRAQQLNKQKGKNKNWACPQNGREAGRCG